MWKNGRSKLFFLKFVLETQLAPPSTPSSLMDSIASLKVKTTEGEGVGACSLARNISGVERHVRTPKWD